MFLLRPDRRSLFHTTCRRQVRQRSARTGNSARSPHSGECRKKVASIAHRIRMPHSLDYTHRYHDMWYLHHKLNLKGLGEIWKKKKKKKGNDKEGTETQKSTQIVYYQFLINDEP